MTTKAATKQTKQSKSKPPATIEGLTPAQSRALRLFPKRRKFTTSDLYAAILDSTNAEVGSLSLARAHVRAWVKAGAVEVVTQGSQGVAGIYKRVK